MPIGRVLLTQREPAKPTEFWGWLQDNPNLDIEIGSLLVAEGQNNERILALVEDMEYKTSATDHLTDFYGSGYGNPNVNPATQTAVIRLVKLRVLYRDPSRTAPPEGRWGIRTATAEDVDVLAQRIPERWRIWAGFLKVGRDEASHESWLPVPINAQFVLGPEGAHVNITGATGLATKTSYALFLAYAALAWAQRENESMAVVLFNVKRRDFLQLHRLPANWDEADQWIRNWATNIGEVELERRTLAMWQQARKAGVDPIALNPTVQYFTYQGDPDMGYMNAPQIYSYGFNDLDNGDFEAALFTRADRPTDPQLILLNAYLDAYLGQQGTSFDQMLNNLDRRNLIPVPRSPEVQVSGVGGTFMSGVPTALRRRLEGFLTRAAAVVERALSNGHPIRFAALQSNSLNVVQLYRLDDAAKRLVVNAVIREVSHGLEDPNKRINRVLVIVDELNKYAPSGAFSPVKEQVIDIVARGRDLQLTLIGAQQFASEIDEQVYGNSGTKVVGYSDDAEISNQIYKYLGDLRDQIPNLKKGQMVLRHTPYPSPLIFWFPAPLHEMAP